MQYQYTKIPYVIDGPIFMIIHINTSSVNNKIIIWASTICLRGFRSSETQTSLLSYQDLLKYWNVTCIKFGYYTFQKTLSRLCGCIGWSALSHPHATKSGFLASRLIYRLGLAVERAWFCFALAIYWSSCTSAQSDRLSCYSLCEKYNSSPCFARKHVFGVSNEAALKPVCSASETS